MFTAQDSARGRIAVVTGGAGARCDREPCCTSEMREEFMMSNNRERLHEHAAAALLGRVTP
jgi:hypothetical protein